jgi:hypothetical protein
MDQPKKFGPAAGSRPDSPAKPAAGSPARPAAPSESKSRPGIPPALPARAKTSPAPSEARSGKVVHDERGNAVWDWLKQTSRNAIESTTRMLKKLEAPELKVEQTHEEELRIQPDSGTDAGGGYDPYNQPTKSRRTPGK